MMRHQKEQKEQARQWQVPSLPSLAPPLPPQFQTHPLSELEIRQHQHPANHSSNYRVQVHERGALSLPHNLPCDGYQDHSGKRFIRPSSVMMLGQQLPLQILGPSVSSEAFGWIPQPQFVQHQADVLPKPPLVAANTSDSSHSLLPLDRSASLAPPSVLAKAREGSMPPSIPMCPVPPLKQKNRVANSGLVSQHPRVDGSSRGSSPESVAISMSTAVEPLTQNSGVNPSMTSQIEFSPVFSGSDANNSSLTSFPLPQVIIDKGL